VLVLGGVLVLAPSTLVLALLVRLLLDWTNVGNGLLGFAS
jgi:hypothetical protein